MKIPGESPSRAARPGRRRVGRGRAGPGRRRRGPASRRPDGAPRPRPEASGGPPAANHRRRTGRRGWPPGGRCRPGCPPAAPPPGARSPRSRPGSRRARRPRRGTPPRPPARPLPAPQRPRPRGRGHRDQQHQPEQGERPRGPAAPARSPRPRRAGPSRSRGSSTAALTLAQACPAPVTASITPASTATIASCMDRRSEGPAAEAAGVPRRGRGGYRQPAAAPSGVGLPPPDGGGHRPGAGGVPACPPPGGRPGPGPVSATPLGDREAGTGRWPSGRSGPPTGPQAAATAVSRTRALASVFARSSELGDRAGPETTPAPQAWQSGSTPSTNTQVRMVMQVSRLPEKSK